MWKKKTEGSIIGKDVTLEGVISWRGCLVIKGSVSGTLIGEDLVIDSTGRVSAEATVQTIIVRGAFSGRMTVSERMMIGATGTFEGKVEYMNISVEDGGILNADMICIKKEEKAVRIPSETDSIYAAES